MKGADCLPFFHYGQSIQLSMIYVSKGGWIEQAMSSSVEEGAKRLYNRLLGESSSSISNINRVYNIAI